MCNKYRNRFPREAYTDRFNQLKLPFRFSEFTPNFREGDYTITDICPVIRWSGDTFELLGKRWSWPGPKGPVFNFRSEGRSFKLEDRVLIPADGYYEFTKDRERYLFFRAGAMFWLAGYVRNGAFSMLTTERLSDWPKTREPVSFLLDDGPEWLMGRREIEAAPAGRFNVERV